MNIKQLNERLENALNEHNINEYKIDKETLRETAKSVFAPFVDENNHNGYDVWGNRVVYIENSVDRTVISCTNANNLYEALSDMQIVLNEIKSGSNTILIK